MSKTTTPAPALLGKTANELREMLANKSVTAKAVVAFLREREAERGALRAPSAKLLAELTGEAKPESAKPEAKPESAKPVAPAPVSEATVLADLLAQVRVLTERIAALEGGKAEPVKPEPVKVVKPEPVKPEPVKVVKPAKVDERPTEASVREHLSELEVGELRARAKEFEVAVPAKAGKDAIIDAMVADAIANGLVVAAAPAKAGKPDLKVVRATEVTF